MRNWEIVFLWFFIYLFYDTNKYKKKKSEKISPHKVFYWNRPSIIYRVMCHIKWHNLCHNSSTWRVVSGRYVSPHEPTIISWPLTTRHMVNYGTSYAILCGTNSNLYRQWPYGLMASNLYRQWPYGLMSSFVLCGGESAW